MQEVGWKREALIRRVIIYVSVPKSMRFVWRVAYVEGMSNVYKILDGNPEARYDFEGLGVVWRIILKRVLMSV
jgi:hypothetical protein